jgi:hypothetical protein
MHGVRLNLRRMLKSENPLPTYLYGVRRCDISRSVTWSSVRMCSQEFDAVKCAMFVVGTM